MARNNLIVFSDFDGTFSERDVGNRIYTYFSGGRNRPLVEQWKKGLISSRECLTREAELIEAGSAEVLEFLSQFELSPGAAEIYQKLRRHDVPFYILSDGLDFYIEHILRRSGLEGIPYRANHGIFEGNSLRIEFPFKNDGCARCGSCKGSRIREICGEHLDRNEIIFIGDGLSDICALPEADVIFARGDLLAYCRSHGFRALEYGDFFDILNWFNETGKFTD